MTFNSPLFRECFEKVFTDETSALSHDIESERVFKMQLNLIKDNVLNKGFYVSNGLEYRTSYYVMQGILEKALAKSIANKVEDCDYM
ncbi:MAG: hypothetical protein ACK5AV_03655 [Alphaproteobacteria bacterium]|jgi:hypothetical protein|nr:hypothetical protein [Candidatus Jidaibacter sp.]